MKIYFPQNMKDVRVYSLQTVAKRIAGYFDMECRKDFLMRGFIICDKQDNEAILTDDQHKVFVDELARTGFTDVTVT